MAAAPHWLIRARAPHAAATANASNERMPRRRDPDDVAGYLQDAARYPGGHSDEVCFPTGEADVAALLAEGRPLLVVGAQSSLTGGATPHGEVVVSTSRLSAIGDWQESTVRCGAGVVLRDLEEACAERGVYFPPVPTYDGATVGGVISTDAAGAATFKHGTTRPWVEALTVVLADGDVLDLERGQVSAHPDGYFEIDSSDGVRRRIPVPQVASPAVPKVSAGYRGGAGMDLIDLFIGSEGTLGVVVEARLGLLRPRPSWMAVLVPVAGDAEAIDLARELRSEALRTRRDRDAAGADVAAIEYMDARCLEILREDGVDARLRIPVPASARALLLAQLELPADYDQARASRELEDLSASAAGDGASGVGPVATLCRLLEGRGLLDDALPVLPGQDERRRALFALREAVPEGVNARVRAAALRSGQAISKAGGDVIVPFERFGEALERYRRILADTGLDSAIWGHISDGNVHPNILAEDEAGMARAREAQVAIGQAAIELGGSPLAEHGTGRNPGKKRLLEALHGARGVESMRATRRALDPQRLLAPGVLFDDDSETPTSS